MARLQVIVDELQAAGSNANFTLDSTTDENGNKDVSDSLTTTSSTSSTSNVKNSLESLVAFIPKTVPVAQEKAYDAITVGPFLFPNTFQVSSQGCSRVFIIKGKTYLLE